jgi:hypothetical protein
LELGDKGVSEEIGKRAGVSHETVRKVETLIHKAPERVQKRLRAGEMSISRAFEQYGCGGGSSRKKQTVVTVQQKQQHRQGQSKAQVAAAAEEEEQEIWQIDPHNYNIADLEKYDKPLLIRIVRLQHQELEFLRSKQQNTKPELSRKHQQQKLRRKRTTGSKNDEKKPEAFAMQKETEQLASRLASQLDK